MCHHAVCYEIHATTWSSFILDVRFLKLNLTQRYQVATPPLRRQRSAGQRPGSRIDFLCARSRPRRGFLMGGDYIRDFDPVAFKLDHLQPVEPILF